jgi:starvation-inducible DNA-binding protein
LNAKRYHWTVSGPHFRDYHLRFEELYLAADGTVDELAERIRMLGGVPIHAPAQIEALSKAKVSDPAKILNPPGMLKEALKNEERVIASMHHGIELANQAGDPGTADLLTRFVQAHQKEAWFLASMN